VYVIKPSDGCLGRHINVAVGTIDAAEAARELLQVCMCVRE